ncbi:polymorphic toxin-type HINT domain-containing protein [Micromonospora sp. CPCC 206060]|uniref:polymorphic toxin-type HINT domain-containing protein n=1 Tax=Micromonospora sp. CPCC 206060 TaxID=3122406 RepID=UPI002FF2B2D3
MPEKAVAEPTHLSPQVEKTNNHGGRVSGKAWPHSPQQHQPAPEPKWPAPGTARATLPAVGARSAGPTKAGTLPVTVDRAAGAPGDRVNAVTVQVLDRSTVPAGWRKGLVLRVGSPTDAPASGTAKVSVDYDDFRYAYGAEWASRLKLWQLPDCALQDPGRSGCAAKPLYSTNDSATGVVTAEVPVAPIGGPGTPTTKAQLVGDAPVPAVGGTLIALSASASGDGGDFGATSLEPSSTWSAGGSSGDFSWSYPMRVPPAVNGPGPSMAVSHSSASVDGRSEATNNQPSWLGQGFEYWPGYIERRYVPCAEDMGGTANNTTKTSDYCWRSDNATMSLNGRGSELIFEAGKGWHARNEDASKIEKSTGAGNGDNDGEHWKVTASDGTQYFFGLHSLPGQTSTTNSAWTVPVAGNNTGEPCHQTSFTGSFCDQVWRWNLDYVVDVRGNTMSYWYTPETNKYARNMTDTDEVSYTRGGTLDRVDYGTWDRGTADRSINPVAQVIFAVGNRCITSSCGTHDATNWPDTPWDQECTGTSCPGLYSPTFWTTKRLAWIKTRVWDTTKTTPDWQDVDSWTFTHSFPPVGDGSLHRGMWLEKIQHSGLVGAAVTMPPVTFAPVSMANRVLTQNTTTSNWQRVDYIITETGAKIDIEYSLPECTSTNLPSAPHTNDKLCYPVKVIDPDDPQGEDLIVEWWHKYVVTHISESDVQLSGGHQAPPKFTYYTYGGTPAWHYADDDGLSKPKYKTWNQFRGFATVKTRVGDVPGAQTLTETRYLRGMHGDRLNPTGGTRSVTVPASIGSETVYDEDQFAGMVREKIVYNGTESKPVSKTVNVPWRSAETASRTINGDTVTARFVNTRVTYNATALGVDASRGWRTSRSESWFSGTYGTVYQSQEDGDTGTTGDEKCSEYTYNRNLTKNLVQIIKRVTTTALPCGTAPTSADHIISDTRSTYDGAASPDTAPDYGSVTKIEQLKDWSQAGGTVWQTTGQSSFDTFGRPVSATDVKGNVVTTAYTPASGGPVTKVTSTRAAPYNWTTVKELNPYWGSTVRSTDLNGVVTDVSYDALGRVWQVWNPGWAKADKPTAPSAEYTYTFAPDRDAYPYTTSKALHAGGNYRTTYQIMDGLLRPRQTQTASVQTGSTLVSDTIYDKLGRPEVSYRTHTEAGSPSGVLWWKPEWAVPAVVKTVYDNANRATNEILFGNDGVTSLVEQYRTTRAYEGDLVKVTPPDGGTPTTTLTDVQGRTVELRQHTTAQGVTGAYQSTYYTYNAKDQLAKVADHVGNEWTYTFDVRGRQIQSTDPDKGTTTSQYNDVNELEKTTDARGEALWYVYDALGRKIELRDDSATGPLRAKWKYDQLFEGTTTRTKGQLTEAYRYEPAGSTNIYKWRVGGFTRRYQPININYVIPAAEGSGLNQTWEFDYGYSDADGSPTTVLMPPGGGLANEQVATNYSSATGLPVNGTYVSSQLYTDYGEPSLSRRETTGGWVEDTTYYQDITRRVDHTKIKPETAAGSVSDRHYVYDDAGNITSVVDSPQVGTTDTQCFQHDALRRLTTAWTPKAGVTCASTPSVANMGGPAPYWLDWTFDTVGNRTQEVSHTAGGNTVRDYTVPTGGQGVVRPHAVTSMTTTEPGQSPVVSAYGYDATGNTTCRPAGTAANTCPPGAQSQTLTWDAEGRLESVSANGSQVEKNIYDANGNRLIRRDATGTTLYLPGQEIRRDNSSILTGTRYYSFNGELIGQRTSAGMTWLYTDHQGTQHTSIDQNSHAVTVRRQTPYGKPRGVNPVWGNPKGFVGGDNDPTGLVHIGARDYDLDLGRFISVDPVQDLSDPQQWNAYAYSNNSPVTFSDPTGLKACSDDGCGPGADYELNGEFYETAGNNDGCGGACGDDDWAELRKTEASMGIGGGGPTSAELTKAKDVKKQSLASIILRAGGQILMDLFGINDIINCISGDAMACVYTLAGMLPIGKAFTLLKNSKRIAGTIIRAGKAVAQWMQDVKWADAIMKKAADAAKKATEVATSCTKHSFAAGTKVVMADGSTRPIEDLEEGDLVLATDPETGKTTVRVVTDTHINNDTDLTDITVEDDDGNRSVLNTTAHHPFWSEDRQEWIYAADLTVGEDLRSLDGEPLTVAAVVSFTGAQVMYDLTVDTDHTYYVIAGETPVLVHNCGDEVPDTLYHYTNEAGHDGILASGEMRPSLKANNPKGDWSGGRCAGG